jgi:hypothetical protein
MWGEFYICESCGFAAESEEEPVEIGAGTPPAIFLEGIRSQQAGLAKEAR